jgi:hypothetical protein
MLLLFTSAAKADVRFYHSFSLLFDDGDEHNILCIPSWPNLCVFHTNPVIIFVIIFVIRTTVQ